VVEVERMSVRYANRTTRDVPVTACPIQPYPSDEWVAMSREEHRLWHRGLTALFSELGALRLTRWALSGVGADVDPWTRKNGGHI